MAKDGSITLKVKVDKDALFYAWCMSGYENTQEGVNTFLANVNLTSFMTFEETRETDDTIALDDVADLIKPD